MAPQRVVALALIVLLAGWVWRRDAVQNFTVFDQPFYLGIAHDLVTTGRFTDGFMFAPAGADGTRPSGMRFAPLYPAMLAASAVADGGLRRGMDCLVDSAGKNAGCAAQASSLRGVQFCMLVGFFWLVWWLGGAVGGGAVGWLSLLLAFGAAPLLARSVDYLMTEMTCLLLMACAMAAGVAAVRGRRRLGWSGAVGVFLGLAALTRPAFLYLIPACMAGGLVLARRRGFWPVCVMGGAAILVVAPWLLRNGLVMGRVALTHGYDSHTLVQRIAFDTMNWREYGLAYLCWLPDGNEMGRLLFGAGACDRFGWDEHPNSFYVLGLRHMLGETLAASGGYEHHLSYLLHAYIFRMPIKHLLVTIPLALRGAYVAHWWGFVLFFACMVWTGRALSARGALVCCDTAAFLILALPAWFMLGLNAGVAVNQVRYNLMLVPAYAVAGALSLCWLADRYGSRISLMRWQGRVG